MDSSGRIANDVEGHSAILPITAYSNVLRYYAVMGKSHVKSLV